MDVTLCPRDTYYDRVVGQCSLCSDICVPHVDHHEPVDCTRYCADYYKRMSASLPASTYSSQTDQHVLAIAVASVITFMVLCVVAIIACFLLCIRRKPKSGQPSAGNELAETSRDQTILPLSVAHAESAAVPDAEEHASLCAFRGGTMMDAV